MLIVARMTPRRNSRTRTLIRALSSTFHVDVISESADRVTPGTYIVDGGNVDELVLPLPDRSFWHLSGLLRVLTLNLRGIWLAAKGQYDIVVCSDSLYAWPGIVGRLIFRRRFVYNAHEIMWALGISSFISTILGWLERLSIRVCDFWMVPSDARAQLILNKHGFDKPYLVYGNYPTGIGGLNDRDVYRTRLFEMGVLESSPIIMFQGSLTEKRGLEQLVDAARSGRFQLIIQGRGRLLPYLIEHKHDNVTILEPCPNEEAVSWLSAADFSFVYYENDCLNSAYACSNKFYASVFAGTPVICNRLPAFELFSDEFGGVAFIDKLENKAIQQCLDDLLNKNGRWNELRQQMFAAREVLSRVHREQDIVDAFAQLASSIA